MMELVCTLMVLGRLCVTDVSTSGLMASTNLQFPASTTLIKADDWQADVLWGSDNPQVLDPKRLSRVCNGDSCVSYFLRCRSRACHVAVDMGPEQQPLSIRLEGRSDEAVERALAGLYFLPVVSDPGQPVPLARFEQSAFEEPYCNRVKGLTADGQLRWDEGCEFLND